MKTTENERAAWLFDAIKAHDTVTQRLIQDITSLEAALLSAREAGRVEGLEEGAKVADRQINHDPAVIGNTDERITHRHCAMDIASAIRALKTEPRP